MSKRITLLSIILIAGQALCLPAYAYSDDQSERLIAIVHPESTVLPANKSAIEQETLKVEEQNHVMPGAVIYAHAFGGDEANRLAQDGILIGSDSVDNYIDLQSGNILLNPEKDITVGTSKGKIYVAAGASIFISALNNDVVIYDLMQTKPKQVSMMVNKHKVVLEPGRMLVVTAQDTDVFEKLNVNCHLVAYRNAVPTNLNSKAVKVFMAEFSIASAITTIQPLQRLTVSTHAEDKLALERLVKGALLLGDFATSTCPPVQMANTENVKVADKNNSL